MSSPILSSNDRAYILTQLNSAPDEILVRAFLDLTALHTSLFDARAVIARGSVALGTVNTAKETEPQVSEPRRNINPGVSTITKIGSDTKAGILTSIADGCQPHKKFEEHCKLLWERGEIKFDGKEWWV